MPEIARELDQDEGAKRSDPPSLRTIERIRARHKSSLPHEQVAYADAYWPESFVGDGPIPWEASRAVLDLIAYEADIAERTGQPIRRPTVGQALWFWRITLAAPGLDVLWRERYAATLDAWEKVGRGPDGSRGAPEDYEAWFARRGWEQSGLPFPPQTVYAAGMASTGEAEEAES